LSKKIRIRPRKQLEKENKTQEQNVSSVSYSKNNISNPIFKYIFTGI